MIRYILRKIRTLAYARGMRPAPGTLLYSPSLDLRYVAREMNARIEEFLRRGGTF